MHVKHYHPEHAVNHSPTVTDLAFIRTHKEEAPGTETELEAAILDYQCLYLKAPRGSMESLVPALLDLRRTSSRFPMENFSSRRKLPSRRSPRSALKTRSRPTGSSPNQQLSQKQIMSRR